MFEHEAVETAKKLHRKLNRRGVFEVFPHQEFQGEPESFTINLRGFLTDRPRREAPPHSEVFFTVEEAQAFNPAVHRPQ